MTSRQSFLIGRVTAFAMLAAAAFVTSSAVATNAENDMKTSQPQNAIADALPRLPVPEQNGFEQAYTEGTTNPLRPVSQTLEVVEWKL